MKGNIFNLVLKDLRLAVHPSVIIYFIVAPLMMLIPSYPRPIGFFYILIAFLVMFSTDGTYKDREFCALLPVKKTDCVKARVLTICLLEIATLLVSIPFCWAGSPVNGAAGMNINCTLYAIILVGYAVSNMILIPYGYRKNFKTTLPGIFAAAAFMILTIGLENAVCRPLGGKSFLNGVSGAELLRQLPVLAGAIVFFAVMNYITCRIGAANYEKAEI